jgi:glycosyltransferase involved in cell wall biosynthesis
VVVEAGCGLSVAPNDPAALAEAVVGLYKMPASERAAMGQRGRDYVRQHHDYALLAGRLDAVVAELEPVAGGTRDDDQTRI